MAAWLLGAVLFVCFLLGALLAVRAGARFWDRYRENFVDQARLNLSDMFLFMDITQLFLFNAVLLVVVPLLVWFVTGSLIIALLLAALLAFLPRKVYAWMKQKRIDKIQEQLPDALQMLSGSLRAGVGFAPAMEVLVHDGQPPLAQELALCRQYLALEKLRLDERLNVVWQIDNMPPDDENLHV